MNENNYKKINSFDENDINTQYKTNINNFYNSQTNFYSHDSHKNSTNFNSTNINNCNDLNTIYFNYKNSTTKSNKNFSIENNNLFSKTLNDYKRPYFYSMKDFTNSNNNESNRELSLFSYNINTIRKNNTLREVNEFSIKDNNKGIKIGNNFNEENKNEEVLYDSTEKFKKNKSVKNIINQYNKKEGYKKFNNNTREEEVCKNDYFDLFNYNNKIKNKFNINEISYNNSNDETNKKINYFVNNYGNNNENFESKKLANINYNNINIGINNNFIIDKSIAKAYQDFSGALIPREIEDNSNEKKITNNKIIELYSKGSYLHNKNKTKNNKTKNKSINSKNVLKTEGNEKKLIKRNNSININKYINYNTDKYVIPNIILEENKSKYEPSLSEKNINNIYINNRNNYFENINYINNKENFNENGLRNIYVKKSIKNSKKINECFNEIEELNSKKYNKNNINSNKAYISKNNFVKTENTINKINNNDYQNFSNFHKNLENIKNRVTDLLDIYSSLLCDKIVKTNENMNGN